ncbi:MAG: hypothetical protein JKY46_10505 [Robiginitomaculum sp.]|nr:hypothetical protein [Robiginitomaculum sp.]
MRGYGDENGDGKYVATIPTIVMLRLVLGIQNMGKRDHPNKSGDDG